MRSACLASTFSGSSQRTFMFMSMTGKFRNRSMVFICPAVRITSPVQVQAVRVEQAEAPPELLEPDSGQYLLQNDAVAVTLMDVDVRAVASEPPQVFDLPAGEVDEVVLAERRLRLQGDEGAAGDFARLGLRP